MGYGLEKRNSYEEIGELILGKKTGTIKPPWRIATEIRNTPEMQSILQGANMEQAMEFQHKVANEQMKNELLTDISQQLVKKKGVDHLPVVDDDDVVDSHLDSLDMLSESLARLKEQKKVAMAKSAPRHMTPPSGVAHDVASNYSQHIRQSIAEKTPESEETVKKYVQELLGFETVPQTVPKKKAPVTMSVADDDTISETKPTVHVYMNPESVTIDNMGNLIGNVSAMEKNGDITQDEFDDFRKKYQTMRDTKNDQLKHKLFNELKSIYKELTKDLQVDKPLSTSASASSSAPKAEAKAEPEAQLPFEEDIGLIIRESSWFPYATMSGIKKGKNTREYLSNAKRMKTEQSITPGVFNEFETAYNEANSSDNWGTLSKIYQQMRLGAVNYMSLRHKGKEGIPVSTLYIRQQSADGGTGGSDVIEKRIGRPPGSKSKPRHASVDPEPRGRSRPPVKDLSK